MLDFNGDEYQRGFGETEFILTPEELAEIKLKNEIFNGSAEKEPEETDEPN